MERKRIDKKTDEAWRQWKQSKLEDLAKRQQKGVLKEAELNKILTSMARTEGVRVEKLKGQLNDLKDREARKKLRKASETYKRVRRKLGRK